MSRKRINLNREWRFFRGDVTGAERIDFDDSQWQRVGLPHTFDLPYFRTPEFYVGAGWYRKTLDLSPSSGTPDFGELSRAGEGWGEGLGTELTTHKSQLTKDALTPALSGSTELAEVRSTGRGQSENSP